ncbi:hypothetical protein CKO39_18330 [Rhodopseudomonas palustris]|nr:hypothetical protein CKO39_18330 [Rhodopseudomonas palustris]
MNVALRPASLDTISLCTGGGGLDLGFELAIPGARASVLVEREAFAVAHLVEAMRQGLMAAAPVWSDVTTFDGRRWRGLVDGVVGGIPCQPHSLAGKRLGADDERDLWSAARRIIVQSGAWFCLMENVEGMLSSGGAERVWRGLGRLGFAREIGLFSAAEVGATHQRNRTFVLAVHDGRFFRQAELADPVCEGWRSERTIGGPDAGRRSGKAWRLQPRRLGGEVLGGDVADADQVGLRGRAGPHAIGAGKWCPDPEDCFRDVADSLCDGQQRSTQPDVGQIEPGQQAPRRRDAERCGVDVADLHGAGLALDRGIGGDARSQCAAAERIRGAVGCSDDHPALYPPGPSDLDGWRRVLAHSPDLEPAVRRMADGVAARLDLSGPHAARVERLRMLGNGVMPLQAAYAVRTLATRLAAAGSAGAAHLVRLMDEVA